MKHLELLLNFCANICLASFVGIGHVTLPDHDPAMDGIACGFDSWAPSWLCVTLPSYGTCTVSISKTSESGEPQPPVGGTQFIEGTATRVKEQNQPGTPKLEVLLGEREALLVESESSQPACLLPHQRKEDYVLLTVTLQGMDTLYYLYWYLSFQQKSGLLSSCLQVGEITSLSTRKFSLIFWSFCLGGQAGVLLMTPWLLKPALVSNEVLVIGFTYRESAHEVLFLWEQQKWVTLWVRNVWSCNSVEVSVQELLPLLMSGVAMPISRHPWREHQVPETPFLACSCGGPSFPYQHL